MRVFDVTISLQVVDMKDQIPADTFSASMCEHVRRVTGYMTGDLAGTAASEPVITVTVQDLQQLAAKATQATA